MKIVTVIGARPQFIKAATVSRALRLMPGLREILVHTGQHYDRNMSDIFFDELEIPRPDIHLGIGSGSHGAQTGQMLEAIERTILKHDPQWVLVYGDTNSTLAGALAAAKLNVAIAHVEAGLRSFNRAMPEEVNRVLTDHVSNLLFAPTKTAVENLSHEGIDKRRVMRVGDVMFDAALFYAKKAAKMSKILARLALEPGSYVLATIHRAENTDDATRLRAIFDALEKLSREVHVVVPIHPRTRKALSKLGWRAGKGLRLIDPVGYLDMVMLEKHARVIATDSGGVQKEAFFYRVPCVTLRTETEWVELVEAGWNTLAPPTDSARLYRRLRRILINFRRPRSSPALYGTGDASVRIARHLHNR
ncbi:MAG: UDP-N-acetylglucosamine 2-epimerase (non-hydrolyzing) [Burkholderiales bacterium]